MILYCVYRIIVDYFVYTQVKKMAQTFDIEMKRIARMKDKTEQVNENVRSMESTSLIIQRI